MESLIFYKFRSALHKNGRLILYRVSDPPYKYRSSIFDAFWWFAQKLDIPSSFKSFRKNGDARYAWHFIASSTWYFINPVARFVKLTKSFIRSSSQSVWCPTEVNDSIRAFDGKLSTLQTVWTLQNEDGWPHFSFESCGRWRLSKIWNYENLEHLQNQSGTTFSCLALLYSRRLKFLQS